jgi:hypothetical protein
MVQISAQSGLKAVTAADLSDREAAFAREYVERGGKRGAGTEAVLAAGITRNRAAARVRASEMLHNPRVLQFLRDELTRKLNAGAALGVATLMDLCQNARSEQVRAACANSLIDRGFGPVISRNATIHATTSIEELWTRLDAAEAAGELIDGTFAGDAAPAIADYARGVDPESEIASNDEFSG